jgi:hypothetical protein
MGRSAAGHNSANLSDTGLIVSNCINKQPPHWPVIVAIVETYAKDCAMTKRRWLIAAIETSKIEQPALPWQRGAKTKPAAFKHIQMHVAPRPKAIAAR